MHPLIQTALDKTGDTTTIQSATSVQGGSINESFRVETEASVYFIKYHEAAPERFFELEAKGLELIRNTGTINAPLAFTYQDKPGESFLVLEWIEGRETKGTQAVLGEKLAALHSTSAEQHGFHDNTYIGLLDQPNDLYDNWLSYYRDKRLGGQLDYGIHHGTITGHRRDLLEKLLTRLETWIPENVTPSPLHGDLWGGNWLAGPGGEPYLIDPSFLYGDRYFELAFTELFGGFSKSFYDAYAANAPISSDYETVKPLYQLYYLLVHLNIFGEMYGARVDEVLERYVG
ncbi:Phosphatidylserine decarboxylase [Lentibacillus sp. JNUCC-1]|uniref:fructosamine kinase family protein n=1 Tax=Lentibacillus sp. JNUCC-1 TaxID=2654513 RepID=UPI0012E70EF3|nr:fructosamine kinase family protein [Lentibacillus sp. JNUCC-1]MUV38370.1 Phosphatidylserine decarboxylase [Lentibacillus sp. JNUCC-1]